MLKVSGAGEVAIGGGEPGAARVPRGRVGRWEDPRAYDQPGQELQGGGCGGPEVGEPGARHGRLHEAGDGGRQGRAVGGRSCRTRNVYLEETLMRLQLLMGTKQHKTFCPSCGKTTNHVTRYQNGNGGGPLTAIVRCAEHSES